LLKLFPVEVGGCQVQLLAQRAAFVPEHGLLLVADAHVGKAASFRRWGVPVPEATTDDTLARLDALVTSTGAEQVVFLGDLLHSARGRAAATLAAFKHWRDTRPALRLTLVRGNHDDRAGDPPTDWGVSCVDEPLHVGGLALAHHPEPVAGAYVLAGHLHPCAWVGGRGHDRLRLPCFHLGARVGVLPAFGAFTGMHAVQTAPGDRVFVTTGDEVRALNSAP
jgi:DNA ligase-associated metallophosphoesterase